MAEQILAEIGNDVENQFQSAARLRSWATLVPGHNESAGKRKSSALIKSFHPLCNKKNELQIYRTV